MPVLEGLVLAHCSRGDRKSVREQQNMYTRPDDIPIPQCSMRGFAPVAISFDDALFLLVAFIEIYIGPFSGRL